MSEDVYLLDTGIASALWDELHENHRAFADHVRQLGEAPLFVSVVSLAEVEYGLRIAPNVDSARQRRMRQDMADVVVLPIGRYVVEAYAELRARLFQKYSPRNSRGRLTAKVVPDLWERTPDKLLGIQENDLWIASQAMERNLVLVTTDRMTHIVEVAGADVRFQLWR